MNKPNVPEGQFKHSMMDPQFGKLVPSDFPDERDAIHIATAAVFAEHDLNPGDHVGLTTEAADVMGRSEIAPLGIVDPFLLGPVKKGERFWVFLYPGTIRSLRHNWSHPAFDKKSELVEALKDSVHKRRMRTFAASLPSAGYEEHWDDATNTYVVTEVGRPHTMEEVLDRAKAYVQNGEYWAQGGDFEGQGLYPEFWTDFEVLTGIACPESERYAFFSCSC